MPALLWDVYCRVIDNLGDAGVGWRLAAGLAARGQRVRLVIDDAAPLAFMAPAGCAGVQVLPWQPLTEPGDVVVEAFGCDPPPSSVAAMAAHRPSPVWLNLEYLSAEPYVERCHGLPSPQMSGPGRGLTKWFFYPGFTARTGGLLREPGLLAARAAFERGAWLGAHGIRWAAPERIACLFCYDNPALPALLHSLAAEPTLLLLAAGVAPGIESLAPPGLRLQRLPWLTQEDFDGALWSADLNFVRGEDSLVRALWAGTPFVWQAYPQHDGAHAAKVEALLSASPLPPPVAALWRAWNGLGPAWPGLPPLAGAWAEAARQWSDQQAAHADLVSQLLEFVTGADQNKP